MTMKTSPFVEGKYGWDLGESGWNLGADENFLKYSYLFDSNIDGIVATLPTPLTGKAYFNTTDNKVYFSAENLWNSSNVPLWFIFKIRTTGEAYQFNGTALVQIQSPSEIQGEFDSLGTAAYRAETYFATAAALTTESNNSQAFTNTLRTDIATASGTTKGAYQVGWSGRTVAARLSDIVNVADVKAANPTFTWNQVFDAAQNLLPTDPLNVGRRGGIVFIPSGDYLITGVAKKAGVVFQGSGTSTRIYNDNSGSYSFTSGNTGDIQDHGGFRDILFDGGDPSSSSGASRIGLGAINIAAMNAGHVRNCVFQRFSGRAISNNNTLSVKFEINNCFFTGNVVGVLLSDGASTALHINECYFAFNDNGVLLNGQSDFHVNNTIIEQNYITGMRIDGTIDQGTIDGCYFERNGAGVGGDKTSLRIENGKSVSVSRTLFNALGDLAGDSGSGWGHIFCGDLDNLSVTECTFNSGTGISGFDIMGASGATKSINYQNNTRYTSSFGEFDGLASGRIARAAAKVAVPATATAAGRPGQWAADASNAYFYTGDGTTHSWRRVATTTF